MMSMFDILALGVIVLSVLVSSMRGLVAEVAQMVRWILAFVVARIFSSALAGMAFSHISPHALAVMMSFLLIFVAMLMVQRLCRSLLISLLSAMGLGGVNHVLGALFGVVKGVVIVTFAVLICAFTDLPKSTAWQEARTAFVFETLANLTVPYLPSYVADKVQYPSV